MPKLTRTQLDALAHLHRSGRQWPVSRSPHGVQRDDATACYSRRTLTALVVAGVARWAPPRGGVMPYVVPAVIPYANGAGVWHVAVPRELADQGGAIARAVIAGEVWARNRQAYVEDWRPRVELVESGAVVGDVEVATYREVTR